MPAGRHGFALAAGVPLHEELLHRNVQRVGWEVRLVGLQSGTLPQDADLLTLAYNPRTTRPAGIEKVPPPAPRHLEGVEREDVVPLDIAAARGHAPATAAFPPAIAQALFEPGGGVLATWCMRRTVARRKESRNSETSVWCRPKASTWRQVGTANGIKLTHAARARTATTESCETP